MSGSASTSAIAGRVHWPSVVGTLAVSAAGAIAWQTVSRLAARRVSAGRQTQPPQAQAAGTSAAAAAASAAGVADAAPAAPAAAAGPSNAEAEARALLDFLLIVGRCKVEKRTGWVNECVPLPESVADHQYRMAIMALSCIDYAAVDEREGSGACRCGGCTCGARSDRGPSSSAHPSSRAVSPARAVRMALVHDLAEALVGDITPTQFSGVSKEQKHKLEAEAMQRIADTLRRAHTQQAQPAEPAADPAASALTSSSTFDIASEVLSLWQEYEAGTSATAQYVKNIDKIEMFVQALEYQQAEADDGTPDALARRDSLARFHRSMQEVRDRASRQDEVAGHARRPQRLLCALIDELQRRVHVPQK